jgi:hypothetical protein
MSKADFGKTVMPYLIMALLVVGGGATAWGLFGALGNGKNSASPRQEASAAPSPALERRAGGEAFESETQERGERRESEEHERGERDDD